MAIQVCHPPPRARSSAQSKRPMRVAHSSGTRTLPLPLPLPLPLSMCGRRSSPPSCWLTVRVWHRPTYATPAAMATPSSRKSRLAWPGCISVRSPTPRPPPRPPFLLQPPQVTDPAPFFLDRRQRARAPGDLDAVDCPRFARRPHHRCSVAGLGLAKCVGPRRIHRRRARRADPDAAGGAGGDPGAASRPGWLHCVR